MNMNSQRPHFPPSRDVSRELSAKYRGQSLRYLENAWSLLRQGETDKASELLWGSMVEATKAVAACKEVELRGHRQVLHYARGIARGLGDVQVLHAVHTANSLHFNFYEVDLGPGEVWPLADEVRWVVVRFLSTLPQS